MTKLEPTRITKAVCVADSSPNKDISALGLEELSVVFWQSPGTARKCRFRGQNDFWPQRQFLEFTQIWINGPTNFDGGTKVSRGQPPDINESKLTNDIATVRNIDAAPPSGYVGALQNFCFLRLISESNRRRDPQTDCRNCKHSSEKSQSQRIARYPPIYQELLAFFIGCCVAGAIGAY
jgi:hypothetical protein